MVKKICIADGIEADSLIGKTVYFEAKRLIKIGQTERLAACRRKLRPGGNKPFYDVIPGTVIQVTPPTVGLEVAGGIYCRNMADIIRPGDLDHWISLNPGKWVMRGDQ